MMTGLLFYGFAYLVVGFLITLFLRYIGLPDLSHRHHNECFEQGAWDSKKKTYVRDMRICDTHLGGRPFEIILCCSLR